MAEETREPFISLENETTVLAKLKEKLAGKANATHTHQTSDVSGLEAALAGKADSSSVYSKSEIDTLIDNVNHITYLNKVVDGSSEVQATEATVDEVCNAYVQTNYSRSPKEKDGIVVTLTDKSNDKVLFMYMNNSWVDISRNAMEIANATSETAGIVKLVNAISDATDSAITPAAVKAGLAGKADKGTTLANYGITDAYNKTEVDSKLNAKANSADVYTKTEVDAKIPRALTEGEMNTLLATLE